MNQAAGWSIVAEPTFQSFHSERDFWYAARMPKSSGAEKPCTPEEFFRSVEDRAAFARLFDAVPDVCLYIKDSHHRYMKVNRSELILHGCRDEAQILGRTDFDFNPPVLAAQYIDEDRRVMKSRKPLLDQLWLVQGADGMPRWYISSKFPIFGAADKVIGIAGVMRPYTKAGGAPAEYKRLTPVCEYVLAHYADQIPPAVLARCAHLSVSQLNREFRRLFRMTPGDYLLRIRLLIAKRRLEETSDPVGTIALDCGFYDQSHFTRHFRRSTGLSPRRHRFQFSSAAKQQ